MRVGVFFCVVFAVRLVGERGWNAGQSGEFCKHTLPMARRPWSKKSKTPRSRKNRPKPVNPMPISAGKRICQKEHVFVCV